MGTARDFSELLLASPATSVTYTASMLGLGTAVIAAGTGGAKIMGEFRGAVVRFAGAGSDNYTCAFKIWRRRRVLKPGSDRSVGAQNASNPVFDRVLVGSGTFTISGSLAAPSDVFGANMYMADIITFTIDPAFQNLIDTLGGGATIAQVYNNASGNTEPSHIAISDLFDAEAIEIEFDLDAAGGAGNVTRANATVDLTR